ncbi:MAG: acetoacetate decarboxylase family protein [Caldisphaeraceae archaeon]|nr:acetoacetate decarboxylase family protein [Caldisphaeraceae archaeon]
MKDSGVLKGGFSSYTIPIQAPLYPSPPWLYKGVEAVIIIAFFKGESVEPLLPKDVEISGDKVMGALWIARYPRTTLGPYNEALIAIQVSTQKGMAYYIPYIYVTNDSALAAGREVAGAPKKLANIEVKDSYSTIVGVSQRGSMEIRAEVRPEYKVEESILQALLPPEGTPLLSLRAIPGIPPRKTKVEEVYWYAKVNFEKDSSGRIFAWGGPARITLKGSLEDPVDSIEIVEYIQGVYTRFDMELGVYDVISEFEV